jgi:predicted dithiol-disulfide oxidoreductase (DUF899 family)
MTDHKVTTRDEWLAARAELLKREKELTRMGDEVARQRQELPWVRVDKEYTFQTADGLKTLAELFDGRSQLVVYHLMFGPDYTGGCPTCSSMADSFNGLIPHLAARDVTMICISRAPLEKLLAYRERMGWSFGWASSYDSEFNYDFGASSPEEVARQWAEPWIAAGPPPAAAQNAAACGVDIVTYISEQPGVTVFARDGDTVYQTYTSTSRGVEFLMGYYAILDRVPKGRDESGSSYWLHRHDEYDGG